MGGRIAERDGRRRHGGNDFAPEGRRAVATGEAAVLRCATRGIRRRDCPEGAEASRSLAVGASSAPPGPLVPPSSTGSRVPPLHPWLQPSPLRGEEATASNVHLPVRPPLRRHTVAAVPWLTQLLNCPTVERDVPVL